MDFSREKLQAFVEQTEGVSPPVFVGRDDVISDAALAARQVWNGPGAETHGTSKSTRLVEGAPGVGKSSILAELKRRSITEAATGPDAPRTLVVNSSELKESFTHVLDLLFETARLEQHEWIDLGRRLFRTARRSIQSLNVAAVGVGLKKHDLGGLVALKERHPPQKWARPVILAIDEAQNLLPDSNLPESTVLQGLHNGCGLPVTLVLAGLGDTQARATEIGLTRIPPDQRHNVGGLDQEHVRALMSGFGNHFGIDTIGHEDRLEELARPCDGWPRHLHIALKALGKELLTSDGDLGRVDWDGVNSEAERSRYRYYRSQRSREMEGAAGLTAAVMRDLGPGDRRGDVVDSIERHKESHPSSRWRLPKGMDAEDFLGHLIHQGALQEDGEDSFLCPIPSFRTHLIEAGRL